MIRALPAILMLALAGCAGARAALPPAPPAEAHNPPIRAGLMETVFVDGPKVTPLALLEDSRCPAGVECVWAGRVRLKVRIDLGWGSEVRELTLGEPVQVADGALELIDVRPARGKPGGKDIPPEQYQFGFRFAGGL